MPDKSIHARLFDARVKVKNPDLDSTNPHFKNRYASLGSTLKEVRAACDDAGISYVQYLAREGDGWAMASKVIDAEGGEVALSLFPVDAPPNPQAFGSNLTYIKRQQAQADWGIVGEEDDDGEAGAQTTSKAPQKRQQKPKDDGLLATAKQRLWDACKAYGATHGMEAKSVLEGVQKRPGYAETPEWLSMAAIELEEADKADA